MNRLENWFCATPFWRRVTQRKLLPWVVSGSRLGDHVLEVGAGPGAATAGLRKLAARVTSLEYDHALAAGLRAREGNAGANIVQGDAAALPFSDKTFSSAVAILVLHHLRSNELQDCALAEIYRVLRPGGVFVALEIPDGWLEHAAHFHSTFVPVRPGDLSARLTAAGFSRPALDSRRGGFRVQATRPLES